MTAAAGGDAALIELAVVLQADAGLNQEQVVRSGLLVAAGAV